MTVSSTNNKNRYEGNGVTTAFAFTGRIYGAPDIAVDIITRATDTLVETLALATHYTVTITGPEAATITITAPAKVPSVTQDLLIRRSLAQTQTVGLPTGTRFPAVSVESALDKVTTLVQDLSENLERVVQLPITSSDTVPGIGSLTTDEVVVYDGTNLITDGTTTADIQAAAGNAAAAAASASAASSSATLASQWASLTGSLVAATDYSAKEYAIGTFVPAGSAKDWAITPEDTLVDGSGYSALHWAAKAEVFAESVNLPVLGAANTFLKVNAAGNALEYGVVAETGDGEWTFRSTAKTGHILIQGQTLGSASSGADLTGTTYQALYEFFWNNLVNTYAPVSSGRGASAAADFAANKTLTVPDIQGRIPIGKNGTYALGQTAGSSTVTLAEANLPAHFHAASGLTMSSEGSHNHRLRSAGGSASGVILSAGGSVRGSAATSGETYTNSGTGSVLVESAGGHTHTISGNTESTGSGTAFSIIPPVIGMNYMIKL